MANIRNFGIAEGRLTKDPAVFTNSDDSKKVMVTVAVQDNYKSKTTGERNTQFINLEAFISNKSKGLGAFDYMHKGDLVGFEYTIRSNNYTSKNGVAHYDQVLFIQSTDLKETKKAQAARANATAATEVATAEEPFA